MYKLCAPIAESPGRPSDVRVSNVTNTSAVLSWSPPDNGGGRPLYEIGYTVNATGTFSIDSKTSNDKAVVPVL